MALRRAIGSRAVRSQAYCLLPTLPSFRRPTIVPFRSFAAPPQHEKKVVKDDDGPMINNDITAPFLRHEALQMMGLDLVEVHRKSDPPVCKIMHFHKDKYNKDVKEKERLKTKKWFVKKTISLSYRNYHLSWHR